MAWVVAKYSLAEAERVAELDEPLATEIVATFEGCVDAQYEQLLLRRKLELEHPEDTDTDYTTWMM